MSFSVDWLALRESADHRARDKGLLAEAAAFLKGLTAPLVVDLGCGAGSNMRALLPYLPDDARCRLVDNDEVLLQRAEQSLAPHFQPGRLETRQMDLAERLEDAVLGADLISAAALLDLCSAEWIERLAAAGNEDTGYYFALNYDGRELREPTMLSDRSVIAAFCRHQQRDKGFGPAMGPAAAAHLAAALQSRGYRLVVAPSAWVLASEQDGPLISALDAGIAAAAAEEGADVFEWRISTPRQRATVGHVDLLALPLA